MIMLETPEENPKTTIRTIPGHLAVSRAMGDVEAKLCCFGGVPGVISASPEVKCAKIREDTDFVVLGCDGVFDVLSNQDVASCVWTAAYRAYGEGRSIHDICGECVSAVIRTSMERRSRDNVTATIIAFPHFKQALRAREAENEERLRRCLAEADLCIGCELGARRARNCLVKKYDSQRGPGDVRMGVRVRTQPQKKNSRDSQNES